jgi:FkbM family methyltransferase
MARRKNVIVCPWAASDRVGRQTLTVPVYGGRHIGALATMGSVGVSNQSVEIDVRTVDGLLDASDRATRPVTFIRCDVVGHEAAVLTGAARTLDTHRPAVLVEIEQRHQSSPIRATFEMMGSYGYEAYFIRASSLWALSSFDLERDQLSMVPDGFVPYSMPRNYVHYFLFVRPGTDLTGLVSAA